MLYKYDKLRNLFGRLLLGLTFFVASESGVWSSEYLVSSISELQTTIPKLRPGDTLNIAPGTYEGGVWISGIQGTKQQPIRIEAADPKNPPLFLGGGSGIQITRCSYLHLSDIHVKGASGNGVNIDEGGAENSPSVGIQLHQLHVSQIGPKGNSDGIKLSGLKEFRVTKCLIESWGDGGSGIDMVGCHEGLIEECVLQRPRDDGSAINGANGVQMKGGTANVTVSKSQFRYFGSRGVNVGGSTGAPYFRPLDATAEAASVKVIGNVFVGGQAAVAFVGVDGAIFENNLIYMPERWAMRILQENRDPKMSVCRNVSIENNVIVFNSQSMVTAINIGPDTAPETFRFVQNTWYCENDPSRTHQLVQLPTTEQNGRYGEKPDLSRFNLESIRKP